MLSNLQKEIEHAYLNGYAIAGFNVFGFEDALAVSKAAEQLNSPALLMVNRLAYEYLPVERWAEILGIVANNSTAPISIHLDHCKDFSVIVRAIKAGFTSVMYDGSALPIDENISNMKEITKIASALNVSVEGEVGFVPYADDGAVENKLYTNPLELEKFISQSGVNWTAISVGQIHRLKNTKSEISLDEFYKLNTAATKPLVIHGGSGIKKSDLKIMCSEKVSKVNFGTSLRLAFGETLKTEVQEKPEEFDRLKLFKKPLLEVTEAAIECIKSVTQ